MYRSVIDSGWVVVTPLTVMVGKNESGKSALLQALHKFSPSDDKVTYDIGSEWPRDARSSKNSDQIVCSARFRLTDEELAALTQWSRKGAKLPKQVEISRDYDGVYFTDLLPAHFSPAPSDAEIEEAWEAIKVPDAAGDDLRKAVEACVKQFRAVPASAWTEDWTERIKAGETLIRASASVPAVASEANFLAAFSNNVQKAIKALDEYSTPMLDAEAYLETRIPTFVYMDDYPAFTGTAQLDEVKARSPLIPPTNADRTLLMILALAGLDLDDVIKKGTANVLDRQFDLNQAGTALTDLVRGRWSQGEIEVAFRADANKFMTFVRVPERKENQLIRLEERSRGFQWFFSFDLMFMHESGGTFKGCVLLLDEPGLHLHPGGQTDLVRRLEAYSEANTVIYTTHLPFMLNLREPQRIRVVSESPNGTVVNENLNGSQKDARLLLEAAFGITLSNSYLVAQRNLVVEGVSDFWIVTELSNLIARSKRKGTKAIPEDVLITPAGGASEAGYLATFMAGQELGVVVLLDSDTAGRAAADQLIKNWLTRYDGTRIEVVDLASALQLNGVVTVEDLFPQDLYFGHAKATHEKEIRKSGHELPPLTGHGGLLGQVIAAFESIGIKFNKGRVARALRSELLAMPSLDGLPQETQERTLLLIAQINKSVGKLKKPVEV